MHRRAALAVALAVLAGATVAAAATGEIAEPGAAGDVARRLPATLDVVSISEVSDLSSATEAAAALVAQRAGGAALPTRGASVGMTRITRGNGVVQAAPSGYVIPLGTSVLPVDLAAVAMSARVAEVIAGGDAVFGQLSASLRGAQSGDVVELQAASGATVAVRVGLVVPDAEVGGTELVVAPQVADVLGITTTTRIVLWGFDSRSSLEGALAAAHLDPLHIRVTRSWDPPNPDASIGMARTKALLGEFAYRPVTDGVALQPGWSDANIVPRSTLRDIGIRAACHRLVQPAVQGALSEIAARGLAGEIDVADSNAVGGCFVPRFNRVTGNLGYLSRHTWGQAIDVNVSQNPQGSVPRLNCDVVRIFRKWGFAWGGNFVSLDGMHFEYVGEPRDQLPYPSLFCPNVVTAEQLAPAPGSPAGDPVGESGGRALLFADDGFAAGA